MKIRVQCESCRHRFVMRSPVEGGYVRVACPHCRRAMYLVLLDQPAEA